VAGALLEAFSEAERALLHDHPEINCALSGAAAVVAVVTDGDHLTVAHVGDSRAMLLRRGADGGALYAVGLTIDHKPALPSEGRRILLSGGSVKALSYGDGEEGPLRVWVAGEENPPGPGLAMSRSLGDTMGKRAGVVATPDVYTATLAGGGRDAYLVVASDGLWEFLGGGDVAALVAAAEEDAGRASGGAGKGGAGGGALRAGAALKDALDALADEAVLRWNTLEGCVDDLTIALAQIA
jgi:serine/threonine protein phosphatase PrpC